MTTTTIPRLLTYRRVATRDQQTSDTSLDAQKEALTQLAARLGIPIVIDFVEIASGAARGGAQRVAQARLLDAIQPGDVVAVSTLDRLARDSTLALRNVGRILNKGARFISLAEGEFCSSPDGTPKLATFAALAPKA
ncbi:MAG: recombinase family protein [Byssovorax sp.]